MKYSNILKFALPAVAGMLATSCTFVQEDYFDESASLRIEHTNQEIQKYLSDSEHGWVMHYFVAGTDDYDFEGFNLFGKFTESGTVTLGSDHRYLRNGNAGKYTEHTSAYEMLREESCVLSFSTWNDILTVFVDPVSPSSAPGSLIDDGEGMHGDDRLVMLSYGPDEMSFRGERHGARTYFKKLDCAPEQYIANVAATKAKIANSKVYEYSVNGADTTFYITGLFNGTFQFVDRLDDPLSTSTQACCFTPEGFILEHTRKVKDAEIQEFTLNADGTALVCGDVTVRPEWSRTVNRLLQSNRKVDIVTDSSCDAYKTMFNALADGISSAFSSQTLTKITFGSSSESASKRRTGIVFYIKASSDKLVGFTAKITVDGDKVTIDADVNDPSGNYSNYANKNLGSLFTDMVSALNGQYSLVPDNVFCPTSIVWTKVSDPSFYFTTSL